MKKLFSIYGLLLAGVLAAGAQTRIIAHRGYWKCEGSAQNSITALQKAAGAKVYGSEFDVQLSADGKVIVNHDDNIQGLTIASTPYSRLKDLTLKNGELLPTLESYLEEGKKYPDLQLILEIKPHSTKEQEDQIAASVVRTVEAYGMSKQVEYISFSLNVCEQLVKLAPDSEVSYLNGELSPREIKDKGLTGIDYHTSVYRKHPEWAAQAKELGLTTNVWTVNSPKDIREMKALGVDYITTDIPVEANDIVQE